MRETTRCSPKPDFSLFIYELSVPLEPSVPPPHAIERKMMEIFPVCFKVQIKLCLKVSITKIPAHLKIFSLYIFRYICFYKTDFPTYILWIDSQILQSIKLIKTVFGAKLYVKILSPYCPIVCDIIKKIEQYCQRQHYLAF